LVVAAMTLAAKKQDRYVLPAVPLLAVAAAVGLRETAVGLGRPASRNLALGAVGLAQLALCAAQRPYYASFYSPLLGGTAAAARRASAAARRARRAPCPRSLPCSRGDGRSGRPCSEARGWYNAGAPQPRLQGGERFESAPRPDRRPAAPAGGRPRPSGPRA